jgi:CubicO group peptidase (beta-lactamase class C family)
VGKQFVATAVMLLVEEGKVNLDASLTEYFPDAPARWQPIQVKNLPAHTSGLAECESDERPKCGTPLDLTPGPDRGQAFGDDRHFADREWLRATQAGLSQYQLGSARYAHPQGHR